MDPEIRQGSSRETEKRRKRNEENRHNISYSFRSETSMERLNHRDSFVTNIRRCDVRCLHPGCDAMVLHGTHPRDFIDFCDAVFNPTVRIIEIRRFQADFHIFHSRQVTHQQSIRTAARVQWRHRRTALHLRQLWPEYHPWSLPEAGHSLATCSFRCSKSSDPHGVFWSDVGPCPGPWRPCSPKHPGLHLLVALAIDSPAGLLWKQDGSFRHVMAVPYFKYRRVCNRQLGSSMSWNP